jgi:hypothetical protein
LLRQRQLDERLNLIFDILPLTGSWTIPIQMLPLAPQVSSTRLPPYSVFEPGHPLSESTFSNLCWWQTAQKFAQFWSRLVILNFCHSQLQTNMLTTTKPFRRKYIAYFEQLRCRTYARQAQRNHNPGFQHVLPVKQCWFSLFFALKQSNCTATLSVMLDV